MNRLLTKNRRGFTLLELVLVMVIIAIALAAVAPKLSGFSRGRKVHDAADQFVSVTRFARSQAIAEGTIYRLTIDARDGQYQLTRQDGQNFVALTGEMGDTVKLPDGIKIEMKSTQLQTQPQNQLPLNGSTPQATAPQNTIDFFSSGRTQAAQVRITADNGDGVLIECPSAAEDFAIVNRPNS